MESGNIQNIAAEISFYRIGTLDAAMFCMFPDSKSEWKKVGNWSEFLSERNFFLQNWYFSYLIKYICTYFIFLLGMKFQNVNILINALDQNEYIRSMQYCWLDKHGAVCQQKGVFRVNCIDCLDRTNVVQTAIAKNVIETQLIKLGLIPPEHGIPVNLRLTIQVSSQNII